MQYKSYLVEQNFKILEENLILFYGENLGLKIEFKDKIKDTCKNCEIISFNQDEILKNHNLLLNEIKNQSLFKKDKILIIDQSNDKIAPLIEEISEQVDDKIFLFSELLDKKSKLRGFFEKSKKCAAVACYQDNEISIKKIILKELKDFLGLSPINVSLIIDNCGLDRSKLFNELKKVKTFFINKELDTEKLKILLNDKTNDDFNILKDEALKGDRKKTNKLLSETLIDNEKTNLYLNLINQRAKRIYEFKKIDEPNVDSKLRALKPPVFWKDKPNFLSQNHKWSINKIKLLQKKTYEIELQLKSNPVINKKLLMKKLIVDICELANS